MTYRPPLRAEPVALRPAKSPAAADRDRLAVAVLDNSDDAIIAVSLDGHFLSWNRGAERIYGYTAQEAIGQPMSLIIPPAEDAVAQENWKRLLAGERLGSVEYSRRTKDGRTIAVSVTVSPMLDDAGVVTGVVAIARDITEQKLTEAALADAHAQTLEASRLKSEFIANMNHELRTPMNGLIGISGLLADTPLNEEQHKLLRVLRVSSETMMAVVNDVLDFAKIEAGDISIADAPFDVRELVDEVASIVADTPGSTLDLATRFDRGLPHQLLGDPNRIRQILVNLVRNAVKFAAAGQITVTAGWVESTGGVDELRVEVADAGPGIDERAQELIFKAFAQADGSMTRRHGGTGLGLTIAKDLVELMGGEIGVRSTLGEGSTFWFTLPLREAPANAALLAQPSLAEARVLVVDGNPATRSMLESRLRALDITVGTADNHDTMLEALRGAARAGRPYDVALVDPGSSRIDADELQRALDCDRTLPAVRLVLLTDESAQPIRTFAGFASCATKPLGGPALFEVILDALDAQPN